MLVGKSNKQKDGDMLDKRQKVAFNSTKRYRNKSKY